MVLKVVTVFEIERKEERERENEIRWSSRSSSSRVAERAVVKHKCEFREKENKKSSKIS